MRFLASLLFLASTVCALPTFTRTQAPTGWRLGGRASSSSPVSFTVALKQRNLDELSSRFESVSDPDSDQYRQFMSPAEILDIVRPSDYDRRRVIQWLHSHGVHNSHIRDFGDALECVTTVATAESLFRTKFHSYTSETDSNRSVVRTYGTYSVEHEVAPLIQMVTGIATFPVPHLRLHHPAGVDAAAATQGIGPQTLQSIYGVPPKLGLSTTTSQGVIEFDETQQSFSPDDLAAYAKLAQISTPAVAANHIVGPNEPANEGDEAQLDVELMFTLNPEAAPWFWVESGSGWLYSYANHFFSTTDVPQVVSISYGWSENDQCSISQECQQLGVTSQEYVQRVNTEFQKIGLRGVSLLVASGDSGANGRSDPSCSEPQLLPDFPAASPYVTSVGATQIVSSVYNLKNPSPLCSTQGYQCPSGGDEQAVSYAVASFASGGGFSNVAAQPSYQTSAVAGYFKSGVKLPPSSYYNATSRGYPDVAAVGNNNLMYDAGVSTVGGTSCSSPIWGAVIALLNQAATAKDGKPLGFLNPLLYKIAQEDPSAFHDITVGDNFCTEDGCSTSCEGFYATKGWDPVTGLGSPNFPALLKYVQNNL